MFLPPAEVGRLDGVDAPQVGQDFGTRAKQAASELALGISSA
jgi:endonuclease YncB( thermonuclease family)